MSKRRKLAAEDEAVWAAVKRTVKPIHADAMPLFTAADVKSPPLSLPTSQPEPVRHLPTTAPYSPPVANKRHGGAKPDLDRPTHRKLSKGRLDIDARIDLHAMTQQVAFHRLANFIAQARAGGLRHVLVITGKGRGGDGGMGVLRRQVPMWLTTEPIKNDISGFSDAARHHGGEGALYVRLKRGA